MTSNDLGGIFFVFKLFLVPNFGEILKISDPSGYSFTNRFCVFGWPGADPGDCIDALQLHPLLVTQIVFSEM